MFYIFHSKNPWLKKVLVPFWAIQFIFMLALISVFFWLRAYSGSQVTNIVIPIVSAVCTVLSVTEIILYAATRLHPLTYLILQLVKTITWLVLFALAIVTRVTLQDRMRALEEQGYGFGSSLELVNVAGFVETLVPFVTFLAALIYAGVIYHRHRRAKSRFLYSVHETDLFPVIADEGTSPVDSHRTLRAHEMSNNEIGQVPYPAELKEGVEVTVLRELGGDWDVHELPATKSVRSSRRGKSVRSLKGVR